MKTPPHTHTGVCVKLVDTIFNWKVINLNVILVDTKQAHRNRLVDEKTKIRNNYMVSIQTCIYTKIV